jgi:PAS domain S-box-containing protein
MSSLSTRSLRTTGDRDSFSHAFTRFFVVAIVSYLSAKLGGTLVLRPEMVWPLWPGCALLVAFLLLAPPKRWPILVVAGLAGFVLYDLQAGLPGHLTVSLILSDAIEVLIAVVGVHYAFGGVPRLNSIESFAKYSMFAVILAPGLAALVSSADLAGNYWTTWRISFFTEALALLTFTPAVLSWMTLSAEWRPQSRAYYAEGTGLLAGLMLWGYVVFQAAGSQSSPALLYSLLPFLLWCALRFGLGGTSTSMVVIACLSIWGAVHGRGPFTGSTPLKNVLSLQLFLFFAAAPFMFLAVLAEEQKEAEQSVRESEERFRLVADTAPAMIWMAGKDKLCNYFNLQWLLFTGRALEAELGNGWAQGVHPEDLASCLETYENAFDAHQPFEMQYRLLRHDGEHRWILDIGVPRFNYDGSFAGYIGSCLDITDRKLAEEALTTMSRRLIQAQEAERSRIARELHDDICQRVVILGVQLELLERDGSDSLEEVRIRIHRIQEGMAQLGTDIQSLSHRLHSSGLEQLGLVAAAQGFCRELSEQRRVEIEFRHKGVFSGMPSETSLCLFRVLQESLHNGVKYSGARYFEVELAGTSEQVHLTVSDSGFGFDPDSPLRGSGLGLISMKERVSLLKGQFSIHSQPRRGTTIAVSVPVRSEAEPTRAAS